MSTNLDTSLENLSLGNFPCGEFKLFSIFANKSTR